MYGSLFWWPTKQYCIKHPWFQDLSRSPAWLTRSFAESTCRALSWLCRWTFTAVHVWNVYCVVTNDRRDTETTETTDNNCFPISHRTNYFRFVSTCTLGLFLHKFYKEIISISSYLRTACFAFKRMKGLSDFYKPPMQRFGRANFQIVKIRKSGQNVRCIHSFYVYLASLL